MFSEEKYYSEYKIIRNKIRKYNSYYLVDGALRYLNTPIADEVESLKSRPWLVLLLIKWVLLDWKYPNVNGIKATDQDVYSLLQLTYEKYTKTPE